MKKIIVPNRAKLVHPIAVILYVIACHYLVNLAQYGGVRRRVPILVLLVISLILWQLYTIYTIKNQSFAGAIYPEATKTSRKRSVYTIWFFVALSLIVLTTGLTGYQIYQSAIPYNGKLSWYLADYFNKKEVPFKENNIHKHGLNGLLAAIETAVVLPDDLYLAQPFTIQYEPGGEITDLYGFLYGQNEDGETESFLISYNADQRDSIRLDLNGFVEATYHQNTLFQPLVDGLNIIDLERYDERLTDQTIKITYDGYREIAPTAEPVYYNNDKEHISVDIPANLDYAGYSFTLQSEGFSTHYIYYDEAMIQSQIEQKEEQARKEADPNYVDEADITQEYFVNATTGYQLVILDAALGSRFYGLRKTTDAGKTWSMHSHDPFLGETGHATGLSFIDEQLGFAALAKSGGSYALLFRSINGGESFLPVQIGSHTITQVGQSYDPFDFPGVPFEKDGQLFLEVSQGFDGDYAGGVTALYVSKDLGNSFEFVKEIKK